MAKLPLKKVAPKPAPKVSEEAPSQTCVEGLAEEKPKANPTIKDLLNHQRNMRT